MRRVAQALITDGRIRYAFLGISVRDLGSLEPSTRQSLGRSAPTGGAYVAEVTAGSPAAAAGIKLGDVITKLDGEAESLGVAPGAKGVAITDVADSSPGARAGLQAGDVTLDVDRRPVTSVDDATRLLGAVGQAVISCASMVVPVSAS